MYNVLFELLPTGSVLLENRKSVVENSVVDSAGGVCFSTVTCSFSPVNPWRLMQFDDELYSIVFLVAWNCLCAFLRVEVMKVCVRVFMPRSVIHYSVWNIKDVDAVRDICRRAKLSALPLLHTHTHENKRFFNKTLQGFFIWLHFDVFTHPPAFQK